jgi:hypothetical protein
VTTFASAQSGKQAARRASPTALALTVRWVLARTATQGPAVLSIRVDEHGASASLSRGGVDESVGSGGPVHLESAEGVEHVEVTGLVTLCFRRGTSAEDKAELLYARTPLLVSLGVPGGCAERPELAAIDRQ